MTVAVVVDADGRYVFGSDIIDYDGSSPNLPDGQKLVVEPVPGGFVHPKYDGAKWVEGATDAEIKDAATPKPRRFDNVA